MNIGIFDSSVFHLCLSWKPADFWVGVYVENRVDSFNMWICFLPMLPLHIRLPKEM